MTIEMRYKSRVERPKIIVPPTKLWVPHNDSEIAFTDSLKDMNVYHEIGRRILHSNQEVPTGDLTASLLHAAYCGDAKNEPEFRRIRERQNLEFWKSGGLWVFNRNLWTQKGVYVLPDFDAKGRFEELDVEILEEKLEGGDEFLGVRFSEDSKVRFAPKETYRLKEKIDSFFVSRDGFIIASTGIEGAKKLGEISKTFIIYGIEIEGGKNPEQRVSVIDPTSDSRYLNFCGDSGDISGLGYALGVLKS